MGCGGNGVGGIGVAVGNTIATCRNANNRRGSQFISASNPARPTNGTRVLVGDGVRVGAGVHVTKDENVGGNVDVGNIGAGVTVGKIGAIVGIAVMVGMGLIVGKGAGVTVAGKKSVRDPNTIVK